MSGNAVVTLERQVVHPGLRALSDHETGIEFRFAINDLLVHLDLFVATIFVKGLEVFDTLFGQLVAELAAPKKQVVRFDQDVFGEFVLIGVLIAAKGDFLHLMSATLVDIVEQAGLAVLFLKIRRDVRVEEALALEEVGEVAASDRKSTRLNSSHVAISYAVFCLKKKKKIRDGYS